MTSGIRARARLTLVDNPDRAHAWGALESGSRSLIFQFSANCDSRQELVSLGAMVTTLDRKPLVWGDVDRDVLLNFWDDTARIYVHGSAGFNVWYSTPIGDGMITWLIDDLYDESLGGDP